MIDFCVMYKDSDARYLSGLLDSIPAGSTVILMNTSESLQTKSELLEIKQENGLTIKLVNYTFSQWSYGSARNELQKYATNEWIFMLDADERVLMEFEDYEIIKNYPKRVGGVNVTICSPTKDLNNQLQTTLSKVVRLYRNDNFTWINSCHEQVIPSIFAKGYDIVDSTIQIRHHGYNATQNELLYKYNRNIELMCYDIGNKDFPKDANCEGLKNKLRETLNAYFDIINSGKK